MNVQISKNSNDFLLQNRNDSKKITKKTFFIHDQKKLPTIIINSKNSELMELSGKEKTFPKSIVKQKSLTLSQTKDTPFKKKLPGSNFNLRKKSTNCLNINNKFNNINNFESLNNSIIARNSSKKILRNYNTFQSEDTYQNPTLKYNVGMNNQISVMKLKSPDDFEISEEDKIFNQYKLKKSEKGKIKKGKTKIKIKLKKKKLNPYSPFSSYDAALVKVYKKMPKIINKIESTKKLKDTMSLFKYQNLLMDVGTKNLNRETREKLNNKFINLRKFSDKAYNLFKESLESIESKEREIIESINTQQNYYKRKMKENKYYTITSSRNIGFINLPNLKFYKLGNSKKKHKKKY